MTYKLFLQNLLCDSWNKQVKPQGKVPVLGNCNFSLAVQKRKIRVRWISLKPYLRAEYLKNSLKVLYFKLCLMFDIKFSYIGPCMFQHLKISFFKRDFSEKIKTLCQGCNYTAQKMKFFIKNLFSKCDQIRELRVCSYLLKKSLIENFIF